MFRFIFFLFVAIFNGYTQTYKIRTVFDKDSLHSISTYIGTYERLVDSLVIKTNNKKLTITQKNVMLFFEKNINEDLGICPYGYSIENLNDQFLYCTAGITHGFRTSMYFFLIDKEKYELVETYYIESGRKRMKPFVCQKGDKILIPYKENFIRRDTVFSLDKNYNLRKFMNKPQKCKYYTQFKLKRDPDKLVKGSCIKLPIKQ